MDLPIICTLSDAELQARRETVLKDVASRILEIRQLTDGFAYRLPSTALLQLAELINLERTCCQFLTFKLTLEPANGPVWLEVTGPPGSKDFLSSIFSGESNTSS